MATSIIDPDGVGSPARDYASLALWESDKQASLSAPEIAEVRNSSGGAADYVLISGWTTTAANYIEIRPYDGYEHAGVWDDDKARITPATNNNCILAFEDYVRVTNMQFSLPNATSAKSMYETGGITATNNLHIIDGCIFDGAGNSNATAIKNSDADLNITIKNSVVYDCQRSTYAQIYIGGSTVKIVNCTIYNGAYWGVYGATAGAVKLLNTIVWDHGNSDCIAVSSSWASGSDYNMSKDDTAPGTYAIHGDTDGKTPGFVSTTAGSEDFHLDSATEDPVDAGAGPSTDSDCPSTDVDGDTRSGTTCDIGFDEYVAAGGTTIECSTGTVTATGLAAGISAGKTIACTTAAVTVAGVAANISAGTTIECSTGAITAVGLQANISAGKTVSCTLALVAATGLQASVGTGATIECSAATVVATGLQATLGTGTTIECSTAAVATTGLQANISAGTTIACTTAPVAVASFGATVQAGGSVQCTTATIVAVGLQASISASTTIECSTGTVTATGLAATVEDWTYINCTTPAIAVAGLAATLTIGKTISCTTGAVVATGLTASIVDSDVPVGMVSVGITAVKPGIGFTTKKPTITFTT